MDTVTESRVKAWVMVQKKRYSLAAAVRHLVLAALRREGK